MEERVRLLHSDGTYSDPMPRDRAAFIVAFTLTGKRPEIVEVEDGRKRTDTRSPSL